MSALPNQSYANLDNPYWLKNPVPYLEISGTPSVTLTNNNGVLEVNGVPITGEPVSNWYLYPALNNIILFGDPNNPDTLVSAGGGLYFNGELLAQAGQISNVSDWALYIALSNVDVNGSNIINVCNISNSNNLTITGNFLTLNGDNGITISNNETNPALPSSMLVKVSGGTGGTLNLRADKGLATGGAVVNLEALAGDIGGYGWGGTVNIKAYSSPSAGLTSKVTIEGAGVNSYAGAVPTVGSLAGYNFIYGNAGVNICAGVPSIFPNVPLTTYVYGSAGVTLEAGLLGDVQVKDSDFGTRKLVPYYSSLSTPSNLVITGRSHALIPNQYVVMSMINNIDFDSQARINNLKILSMSNGVICNVSNINLTNINGQPYAPATAWSTYPAVSSVNMSGCNISNVGTINGVVVQSPSIWATYPAIANVDMSNYSISNLSNVNGVLYSPTCNWANFTAVSNVDVSSNQIVFSGKRIREGAGYLNGASTSVEIYTPVTIGASTRTASVLFSKISGGVPDYTGDTLLYAFNVSNPARLLTQSTYGTETIAYLSDVGVRPSYDIYVAPNGSDVTGDGSIQKPFLTIGSAITLRATISATVMVAIHLRSGTYTENIVLATNTSLVGETGTSDPAPDPVVIVGTVSSTANGIGIYALTITGTCSLTGVGNTCALNNVTINSSGTFCLTGNSTCSVTSCRFTNTGGGCINVTLNGVFAVRDSVLTISSAGANVVQATGSIDIIRSSVESTSTSASASALVRFLNTGTVATNIRFSRLNYTSTTVDVGGNKCCVQFAGTGTNNSQIAQCVFECVGATTSSGGNVQCIQYTGTGTANLTYGDIQAVGNAHNISPSVTKTAMVQVP